MYNLMDTFHNGEPLVTILDIRGWQYNVQVRSDAVQIDMVIQLNMINVFIDEKKMEQRISDQHKWTFEHLIIYEAQKICKGVINYEKFIQLWKWRAVFMQLIAVRQFNVSENRQKLVQRPSSP